MDRPLWRSRWSSNHVDLAIDIALWDLKARRFGVPPADVAGRPRCSCSLLRRWNRSDFPLDKLLAQTVGNLERGFRAIKMKVGRPRLPKTWHGQGYARTPESIFR